MFCLSRLYEVKGGGGGGGEKILPVSLSFWSNLKFFKIISLAADYVDGECKWNSLALFLV